MKLRQKTLDEIPIREEKNTSDLPEQDYTRDLSEKKIARNMGLEDARERMLYDHGLKPSTRRERLEVGITRRARPGQDIYILNMPMGHVVAIAISEVGRDIKPPLAVAIEIFHYDSNRKSAIEHAQTFAVHYRDSIAEELGSWGMAKWERGGSYSS